MIDIDLSPMRERLRWRVPDLEQPVPGTGMTHGGLREAITQLIGSKSGGSSGRRLPFAPVRPKRAALFVLCGLACLAASVLTMFSVDPKSGNPGLVNALLFPVSMLSALLLIRGAACLRPTAEAVVAADARPPVVYLRSFTDDAAVILADNQRGSSLVAGWMAMTVISWKYIRNLGRIPFKNAARVEQAVARTLKPVGPFVAIGEPGEAFPDFGALKAYYEGGDDEWRKVARRWIEQACIVVVLPGTTPGLAWEIEQVLGQGFGHKLLMVLPSDRDATRRDRLAAAERLCPDPKWKHAFAAPVRGNLLAVVASPDGEIVRVLAQSPEREEMEVALEIASLCILRSHAMRQSAA